MKFVYLYSTIKMMHGPINIRFKKKCFSQWWTPLTSPPTLPGYLTSEHHNIN